MQNSGSQRNDSHLGTRSAKIILLNLLAALTMIGACSVTSLQCGTDGDSSFVNLNTTPKVLSQNTRNMAELCSFAYDELEVQGVLRLEQ